MRHSFLNRKTTRKEEYENVVLTIKDTLNAIAGNKVSFLVYGSFFGGRLMPGISDIDCVLFFWDKFVIDAEFISNLSKEFRNRFAKINLDLGWFLDVSIVDAGNAKDGRFIPYNDNFSKIFMPINGDSKLVYGRSFAEILSPVTLIDPTEARIAFNLQALRQYILFGKCNYHFINGANLFKELKLFSQVRSIGRKVMQLIEPNNIEMIKDKKIAFNALKNAFPSINFTPLNDIEELFTERNAVIDLLTSAKGHTMLLHALTCYEQIVCHIVKTVRMRSYKIIPNKTTINGAVHARQD